MNPVKKLTLTSALAGSLLLAGCTSSPMKIDKYPITDGELRCDTEVINQALNMALAAEDIKQADGMDIRFLLLSGGGSYGAWGAGFLKGLSEGNNGISPPQVVTGVSTGALQSTYAFLGKEDDLYALYTSVDDKDIWKGRFPLLIPFSSSLRTVTPMRRLLDKHFDMAILEQVSNQNRRLLCVGSVVAETGEYFAWNLSGIARKAVAAETANNSAEAAHWLAVYKEAIVASAAVPVMFPPVRTEKGQNSLTHLDGAVRSNVFYASMDDAIKNLLSLRADQAGAPIQVDIIVNGQPGIESSGTPTGIVKVGVRSLSLALSQLGFSSAVISQYHALTGSWPIDSVRFNFSYIPRDRCVDFDALDFDAVAMKQLANAGRAQAKTELPWFDDIKFEVDAGTCDR